MNLQGTLTDTSASVLLRNLAANNRTGVLHVQFDNQQIEIWVRHSLIQAANLFMLLPEPALCIEGEQVLYELLDWTHGRYRFQPHDRLIIERNVFAPLGRILASRHLPALL